jgi:hypothetical protein
MLTPRHSRVPAVALSWGLGADSTAVLLRWLAEPATAPCDLADLIVVTAMTGDEWAITGQLAEAHVLPRLTARQVRYAQVARAGPRQAGGIAVLGDSRAPARLHLAGAYPLSAELLTAGTIPQLTGTRKCSLKAKGHVIDTYLAQVTGGRPFLHAMGYETSEQHRARRDTTYNTAARTGIYPLIDWGWDRAACEHYIRARTGVRWPKSACTYCPFALTSRTGRARVLDLYLHEPAAAIRDLTLELTAVTLNPRQTLAGHGNTLAGLLAATGRHDAILAAFASHLDTLPWQICEIRRAITRGRAARSLQIRGRGTRAGTEHALTRLAAQAGATLIAGTDGITRAWLRHRTGTDPDAEHFLAATPAGPAPKTGPGFAAAWHAATT